MSGNSRALTSTDGSILRLAACAAALSSIADRLPSMFTYTGTETWYIEIIVRAPVLCRNRVGRSSGPPARCYPPPPSLAAPAPFGWRRRSRAMHDVPVMSDPAVPDVLHQHHELVAAHADQTFVIAGLEVDFRLVAERVVHDGRHAIRESERRHRSAFTIDEDAGQLRLAGEMQPAVHFPAEFPQTNVPGRWQHGHDITVVVFENHRLRQPAARHMRQLGGFHAAAGMGMCDNVVAEFTLPHVVCDSIGDCHCCLLASLRAIDLVVTRSRRRHQGTTAPTGLPTENVQGSMGSFYAGCHGSSTMLRQMPRQLRDRTGYRPPRRTSKSDL